MVTIRAIAALAVLRALSACASQPATDAKCPGTSTSVAFTIPSGFGVSISDTSVKAAFNAIRDYFRQNPAATGPSGKAEAADLAANAAAKETSAPMTDEQKRALRSEAGEWVDTYTEKCRPGAVNPAGR